MQENTTARNNLRVLGFLFIIGGIVCMTISIRSSSNFDFEYSFLGFIAMPLFFFGFLFLILGFMGALTKYQANEIAPIAKDTTNYMIDGTKESIINLVKDMKAPTKTKCPSCDDLNDLDAMFCDNCGIALLKKCSCGVLNEAKSRFCKSCGKRV